MQLEVQDLHASYSETKILYGVSFTARKGEVTCILGRNGVGKSTTLKTIMGLVRAHAGSIRYQDRELVGQAPYRIARAGIGFVPEERRIFPTLSVAENLLMGAGHGNGKDNGWSVQMALETFPRLRERIASKGRVLSGGEQQMLAIARALVANPEFLLIDEPTEGLAPVIVQDVEEMIRKIVSEGIGVVLVESKLAVAERLASRIYVMSKGRIAYDGTPNELRANEAIRKKYLEV